MKKGESYARWTKKRGENHYGYKNHVKADKNPFFLLVTGYQPTVNVLCMKF